MQDCVDGAIQMEVPDESCYTFDETVIAAVEDGVCRTDTRENKARMWAIYATGFRMDGPCDTGMFAGLLVRWPCKSCSATRSFLQCVWIERPERRGSILGGLGVVGVSFALNSKLRVRECVRRERATARTQWI